MYIRKTAKSHQGKSYTNYLLVESVSAPPRVPGSAFICCARQPRSRALAEQWRGLAQRLEASLQGQTSLAATDPQVEALA